MATTLLPPPITIDDDLGFDSTDTEEDQDSSIPITLLYRGSFGYAYLIDSAPDDKPGTPFYVLDNLAQRHHFFGGERLDDGFASTGEKYVRGILPYQDDEESITNSVEFVLPYAIVCNPVQHITNADVLFNTCAGELLQMGETLDEETLGETALVRARSDIVKYAMTPFLEVLAREFESYGKVGSMLLRDMREPRDKWTDTHREYWAL